MKIKSLEINCTLCKKSKKEPYNKEIWPREKNRKKFSFDSFNFPRAYSGTIKNILSPILEAVVYMYVHFFVFNFSHEIVYKLIFCKAKKLFWAHLRGMKFILVCLQYFGI